MTSSATSPGVRAARALLALASLAALVAAASPTLRASRAATLRVLLHDASASRGARAAPEDDELAALVEGLDGNDRVAVVAFGADARVAAAPCPPSELSAAKRDVVVDPHGTSLVAAFAAAARLATADEAGRRLELVLATDARATDDAATLAASAASLASARCASWRGLRRESAPGASVVATLAGPGAARAGEPFALTAGGVAVRDGEVVEVSDAAGVVETRRVGAAGPFRLAFARIEESGAATYAARIVGGRDLPGPTARVAVGAPGRALVVADESTRDALRRALPADVAWAGVHDVTAERLAAYDVVVLDDAASARAYVATSRAVVEFVRRGGGLVLLGGPEGFAADLWNARPLEAVSPLHARPPKDRGVFVYLAVDGSGSMAETWGDATRDAVVRGALESLIASASDDVTVALRRFSHDLLPEGAPAQAFRLDAAGRDSAIGAVRAFSAPAGPTALLPPLTEGLRLATAHGGRTQHVVLLTDGRTAESAEYLQSALIDLRSAGVGTTFVLPGDGALSPEAHTLAEALVGTGADVRGAASPERLADVFRSIEAPDLEKGVQSGRVSIADESGLIDAAPDEVAQAQRVFASEDARVLLSVVPGLFLPLAAIRREGLGAVAALATRPGDPAWLAPGAKTSRLVASLIRAVARKASGRLRVERDGPTRVLVRYDAAPGGDAPTSADARRGATSPLVPADGGLLAADVPRDADWIDLLAADGRVVATAGLDAPAPAEYLDPAPADLDALAALACGAATPPARPIAPWLAAAGVLLALAAVALPGIKSRHLDAR